MTNIDVTKIRDFVQDYAKDTEYKYGIFIPETSNFVHVSYDLSRWDKMDVINCLPSMETRKQYATINVAPHIIFSTDARVRRYDTPQYHTIHCTFTLGSGLGDIFAFCAISGSLFFNGSCFLRMDAKYEEDVKAAMIKIIEYTRQVCDNYLLKNSIDMTKDDLLVELLSNLMYNPYNRRPSEISPEELFTKLSESIFRVFTDKMNPSKSQDIMMSNKLFRSELLKMNMTLENAKKDGFARGLTTGSRILASFLGSGYLSEAGTGNLYKIIKIIPDICCYNNIYYQINENARKWSIEKLIFKPADNPRPDQGLTLNCIGYHPNVNNGRMCIGGSNNSAFASAIKDGSVDTHKLTGVILGIEDSMRIINFDSAFTGFPDGFIRSKCKKVDISNIRVDSSLAKKIASSKKSFRRV